MKYFITAIFTMFFLFLSGCGADTTHLVVKKIEAQPSGVLITYQGKNTTLADTIQDPHFTYSKSSGRVQNFVFTIHNVSLSSTVPTGESKQTYGHVVVRKHGKDVTVTLPKLLLPYKKWQIGASESKYVGIALQHQAAKDIPPPQSTTYSPKWFQRDILLAARHEGTPMAAVHYMGTLPLKMNNKTHSIMAPYVGVHEDVIFASYFGAISMYQLYGSFNTPSLKQIHTGALDYGEIRERVGRKWISMKFVMTGMGNGWSFGFAKNQVLIVSEQGGIFRYTVYPVKGIRISDKA